MIQAGAHRWPLRIYFEDTDAGGIAYHARFLAFAERGRTEALRELGVPHQELVDQFGLIFLVRRVIVDYLSPARLDEAVCVVTRVRAVGGVSVTLEQCVESDTGGAAKARIEVVLVCVKLGDNRPARVPPRWRSALLGLLQPS